LSRTGHIGGTYKPDYTVDATSLRELTATVYLINLENEPGASQRLLAAVAAAIQPEIKKKLNSIL
jgi:hypothetical protein